MLSVVVTRYGGPEVLELQEAPEREPGPGEVLVDVTAAGVNFRDVYERSGKSADGPAPPFVPGVEAVGRVRRVGAGAEGLEVGQRVGWVAGRGSYAERVVVAADLTIRIPDGVDDEAAAAVLLQGVTAHYLSTSCYPVRPDDVAVVHAAAGGVGQLLVQLLKRLGATVIATASTDEKRRVALSRGADHAVKYGDLRTRVMELTDGAGAHVVFDGVGRSTFSESVECVRERGYMVLFGSASGPVASVEIPTIAARGIYVTRPSIRQYATQRHDFLLHAGAILALLAAGDLTVRIDGRYGLNQARDAHAALESRQALGKLLLLPGHQPRGS